MARGSGCRCCGQADLGWTRSRAGWLAGGWRLAAGWRLATWLATCCRCSRSNRRPLASERFALIQWSRREALNPTEAKIPTENLSPAARSTRPAHLHAAKLHSTRLLNCSLEAIQSALRLLRAPADCSGQMRSDPSGRQVETEPAERFARALEAATAHEAPTCAHSAPGPNTGQRRCAVQRAQPAAAWPRGATCRPPRPTRAEAVAPSSGRSKAAKPVLGRTGNGSCSRELLKRRRDAPNELDSAGCVGRKEANRAN